MSCLRRLRRLRCLLAVHTVRGVHAVRAALAVLAHLAALAELLLVGVPVVHRDHVEVLEVVAGSPPKLVPPVHSRAERPAERRR